MRPKLTRSRISWFLAVMVSTILATSFLVVPAVNAATADTATPVLTSFSVSATQATPGQQVTFSYVATDDSGSLGSLRLGYGNDGNRSNTFAFDQSPVPTSGSLTITVPDTWWNGGAYLMWVELTDPAGNTVLYYRDGSTAIGPAGATGPTSHTLPFAAADLTLSGSTADSTIAALTSVATSGSPTSPGQAISVHYSATDASGGLKSVELSFRDAYQIERTVMTTATTGTLPLSGVFDKVIPATWPNGTYLLDRVRLADAFGTIGDYKADGSVFVATPRAQGPASHTVDLGLATFTVTGSTADFNPPQLTSIALTGSPMLPGGAATLSYTAESQHPLTYVSFTYAERANPLGNQKVFGGATSQLNGTQSISFPGGNPGDYDLTRIYLADAAGNSIRYLPDGTTSQYPGGLVRTHNFAMKDLGVVLLGTPPNAPTGVGARARSTAAVVGWNAASVTNAVVSSYIVTAQPGGRTVTTDGLTSCAEFTGLTNGTTYRFTVQATNRYGTSQASAPSAPVTLRMSSAILDGSDFNGDGHSDLIALKNLADARDSQRTPYLYLGNGAGGFASGGKTMSQAWGMEPTVFSAGDFNTDGKKDVMSVGQDGFLWLFSGKGANGFNPGRELGKGWGNFLRVFASANFSGGHNSDVMAVSKDGGLYLYGGNGAAGFAGGGHRIGNGWAGFLTVFSPGDFSGDGRSDIMAVSKDGGLYLYRGNGRGGFAAAGQRIGNGWGGFISVISAGGDFSGDHKTDLLAVNNAGNLILYRGNGRGGFAAAGQSIGKGWAAFR